MYAVGFPTHLGALAAIPAGSVIAKLRYGLINYRVSGTLAGGWEHVFFESWSL